MRRLALLAAVGVLAAAGPRSPQTLSPNISSQEFSTPHAPPPPTSATAPGYTAAPTPNDDMYAPVTRASKDASVGPGFFSRRDQYRGEGISPGSSAQIDQERHVKPGAGISLRMPLQ